MKGQILEIVKKNLISIICGVVAIAAVAVAFTMLAGDKAKLQTELDARKQAHGQLAGLLNADRTLPTIQLGGASAEKLTKFPSEKIIQQGDAMVKELEKASKEMVDAAVAMNKHEPLQPGSLPAPNNPAALMFRERYQAYFPPQGVAFTQSQFTTDLNAGIPPTQEEVRIRFEQEAKKIRDKRLQVGIGFNNADQVKAEIDEMGRALPGQLRDQIAKQKKVYINATTFAPHTPIVQAAGAPGAEDIYWAQLLLWLQQDVVAAVNDANANSKNVAESTVKHLIRVAMQTPGPVMPASGTPANDPDAAITKEPTVSPTGRASNGMYDVYHIVVEADVDAAKLPEFLRSFGRNRFITPLWADVKAVDLALERAAGHDYGNQPVVNVKAVCEVLYLRAWTKALMPADVKTKMGITEEGAAPAAVEETAMQ